MTLSANIRINTALSFPARLQASLPVAVTKNAGVWSLGFDINDLPVLSVPLGPQFFIVFDTASGQFWKIPPSALPSFTGFSRTQTIVTASPYNVVASDMDLFVKLAVPAPVTINFPPASGRNGISLRVKDLGGIAQANNITLNVTPSDLFDDGAASYVLNANFEEREFLPVFANNQWFWSVE